MDGIKDALSKKILGLPGFVWLLIGVVLFFVLTRKSSSNENETSSFTTSTPTGDQMTANAVSDLKTSLQADIDDKFGDITQANADALAGTQQQLTDFMGAQANWFQQLMDQEKDAQNALMASNQSYISTLQQQNQSFLTTITQLLTTHAPNTTAPPQTSDPTVGFEPWQGAPSWLKQRLESPYWQTRKYVKKDDTNFGNQYQDAVNAFFRSDNPTGLNSAGNPSQAAISQLNQLIAQGLAAENPLYQG